MVVATANSIPGMRVMRQAYPSPDDPWTAIGWAGDTARSDDGVGGERGIGDQMQWFRRPILSIAERPAVERFTRSNRLVKSQLVDRFVTGETLAETLPKVVEIYR